MLTCSSRYSWRAWELFALDITWACSMGRCQLLLPSWASLGSHCWRAWWVAWHPHLLILQIPCLSLYFLLLYFLLLFVIEDNAGISSAYSHDCQT